MKTQVGQSDAHLLYQHLSQGYLLYNSSKTM